jgi:hypothetical protein
MIYELLIWATFPVGLLLFGWTVEDEDYDGWFLGTVAAAALFYCGIHFGRVPVWTCAIANWRSCIQWVGAYVFIGIVWSILKTYWSAIKLGKAALSGSEDILGSSLTGDARREGAKERRFEEIFKHTPKWIAFWPASLAWSFVRNWIKGLAIWTANRFKKVYRKAFEFAIGDN